MNSLFIISFINGTIFAVYCYLISYILLHQKEIDKKNIILSLIPFFIVYYCNYWLLDSIYAMFFSGLCAFYFVRKIFQVNLFTSLFISIIINAVKMINKIIILSCINDKTRLLINTYKTLDWNALYINTLAMIIATICIFLFRKSLRKLINYVSGLRNRKLILLISVYLNFILILIYQPPDNFFCIRTVTDFLMIFTVTGLGVLNVSSEMKMEVLMKHYQEIFDYSSANAELLKFYKMQVHENKNRLIMIKGMLSGPKKETIKYIDSLLQEIKNNKTNCYYWLSELRYIPLAGVRNFINYKLIQLTELNAEVEVFVSSDLEKIHASFLDDKIYNQITTILGIILDNMIEATKEAEEKLVSINIYIEDNVIHGEFANYFSGDLDASRLNEIGYTTKGEKRGVGLALVDKITKESSIIECTPKIIDNFFIQHLTINIAEKNKLLKNSKK